MSCLCSGRSPFEAALRKGDVAAALAYLEPDPLTVSRTYFRLGNTLWHVTAKAGHAALMAALAARLSAVWPEHGQQHGQHPTGLPPSPGDTGSSPRQQPQQGISLGQLAEISPRHGGANGNANGNGNSGAAVGTFARRSHPFQRISDGLRGRGPDPLHQPLAAFISSPNVMGNTPLMLACQRGHVECVRLLLALGATPWSRDRGNCTALHYAALRDHAGCIEAILQHSSSARPPAGMRQTLVRLVDLPTFCGYTPVHFTAAASKPLALGALLAGGANIAARCWAESVDWISGPRGSTPLHFTARRGDEEMCKIILSHYWEVLRDSGAVDPRLHMDIRGTRPHQLAAERGCRELAEILLPSTPLALVFGEVRLYKVPKLKALASAALQERLLAQINDLEVQVVERRQRLAAAAARGVSGSVSIAVGDGGGSAAAGADGSGGVGRSHASFIATVSGALRQSMRSVQSLRQRLWSPWQGHASRRLSQDRHGNSAFPALLGGSEMQSTTQGGGAGGNTATARSSTASVSGIYGASGYGASTSHYGAYTMGTTAAVGGVNGFGGHPSTAGTGGGHPSTAGADGGGGGVAAGNSAPRPSDPIPDQDRTAAVAPGLRAQRTAAEEGFGGGVGATGMAAAAVGMGVSATGVTPLMGTDWPVLASGSTTATSLLNANSLGIGVLGGLVPGKDPLPHLPGGISPVRGTSFDSEQRPEFLHPTPKPTPTMTALSPAASLGLLPAGPPAEPLLVLAKGFVGPDGGGAVRVGSQGSYGHLASSSTSVDPGLAPANDAVGSGAQRLEAPGTPLRRLPELSPHAGGSLPPPQEDDPAAALISPSAPSSAQLQPLPPYYSGGGPCGISPTGSIDGSGRPGGHSPPRASRNAVPGTTLGLQPVDEGGPADEAGSTFAGGVPTHLFQNPGGAIAGGSPTQALGVPGYSYAYVGSTAERGSGVLSGRNTDPAGGSPRSGSVLLSGRSPPGEAGRGNLTISATSFAAIGAVSHRGSGQVAGSRAASGTIAAGGVGGPQGLVVGSDTSEDYCGVCFERVAFLHIWPCQHALCAECSREVTRMVETQPPTCPFCRGIVHGFSIC